MLRDAVLDTQLHWTDAGHGVPVVLMHGLAQDLRLWDPCMPALSATHRVIRFDHRGHGLSAPIERRMWTLDDAFTDAVAFLERLDTPVHLAGISMGGFIAIRIAARRPDLVRSVTYTATSADAEHEKARPTLHRLANVIRAGGLGLVGKPIAQGMFATSFARTDRGSLALREWQRRISKNHRSVYKAINAVADRPSVYDEATSITLPGLVVHGDKDTMLRPSRGLRLAEATGTEYVELEDCGHTPSIEKPAEFCAAMSELWTRVDQDKA